MNFPCFAVDMAQRIDHGFSGGPVFFDGALCGIISAANDFDTVAYVASLWPLLRSDKILDLLRMWKVTARGWEGLQRRIYVHDDERGSFLDIASEDKTA